MSGTICSAPCEKIISDFICGSYRACRVRMCGSGNMAEFFGVKFLAPVVFVDPPNMGGTESITMPVLANGGLQLAGTTFGFS